MTNFVEFKLFYGNKNILINIDKIHAIGMYRDDEHLTCLYTNNGEYIVKHTYDEVISMISRCDVCIVRLKN